MENLNRKLYVRIFIFLFYFFKIIVFVWCLVSFFLFVELVNLLFFFFMYLDEFFEYVVFYNIYLGKNNYEVISIENNVLSV